MHSTPPSLEKRIHQYYAGLPGSERKLADLLLNFPGNLATYSAGELAVLAGVSNATASRLFRRLGFRNYDEARRLARDTQNWGAPLYLQPRHPNPAHGPTEIQTYLQDEILALTNTMETLEYGEIDQIVTAMASAERLWFIGYRYNHVIAAYGQWQFSQFRNSVYLLPVSGQTLAEHTVCIRPQDVVIVSGFRRRTANLTNLLELITSTQARVLYLTEPAPGALPTTTTWNLHCRITGAAMFDSYTAPISLVRYLSMLTFNRLGDRARGHLENIERHHEILSELANP